MEFAIAIGFVGFAAFGIFIYLVGRRDEHLKQENDWLRRKVNELTDDMHRLDSANRAFYTEMQAHERRGRGRPAGTNGDMEHYQELVCKAREMRYRVEIERKRDEAKYAHWDNLLKGIEDVDSQFGN